MYQYQMMEFVYEGAPPKESFVCVDLNAEFIHPLKCEKVRGFYDGDGIYRVRFLPEFQGEYHYKIDGLFREEGTFTVAPADDQHHGPVRADGTHFKYADGKNYNAIGTTVYALAHQEDALIKETLDSLKNAPFNKIRLCVFPKDYQYNHNDPVEYPFELTDPAMPVPDFNNLKLDEIESLWNVHHPNFTFWKKFENILKQLQNMSIEVDLILFHPYDRWGFSKMGMKDNLVYLDYVLRRLSAFPNIWWSMANEYDLMKNLSMDDWYAIENYIVENDPFQHLISCHNFLQLYDYGRKNITHVSIQSNATSRTLELLQKYEKPVSFDECTYEGNLEESFGSITGQMMTANFWKVFVNGGHCTHGETYIDYSVKDIDNAVVWWAKGGKLIGESPKRIRFLRALLESLPGPIEPCMEGISQALLSDPDQLQQRIANATGDERDLLQTIARMNETERFYQKLAWTQYIGHVKEDVYLYYFAEDQHGRVTLHLPETHNYDIDLIDTWNMTRENIKKGVNGKVEILISQKQWMAAIAYRS